MLEMKLGPVRIVPIVRWQMGNAHLSEGRMSAPALSPETLSALGAATEKIVDSLSRELDAAQEEYNLVSPAAVRVDPRAQNDISYIGGFPPQEIRTAIQAAAREIGNLADRVLSGAVGSYLPEDQRQALQALKVKSGQLVLALENLDSVSPPAEHQSQIQKYMDMHLADASLRIRAAEQGIVQAEAGSVPVLEPDEKISGMAIVAGVGVATGVGILLWAIFS